MQTTDRILAATPLASLSEYLSVRGGAGLEAARAVAPDSVIAELEAAGLRGRGGAGFPTGKKWRTVFDTRSGSVPTSVVVNAAEGEPGTQKDSAILMNNPYQVIEGALIGAAVVGASEVVIAMKASAADVVRHVRAAVNEVNAAGWARGLSLSVFEGPDEYLYGEETALLEVLDGNPPFPRIAPPFHQGIEGEVERSHALLDNVETMANVPGIVLNGAKWFRGVGTDLSPGTVVCTITGGSVHDGIGEVPLGTTLREAIVAVGGGVPEGRAIKAVMPGTSNALIPGTALDTPLTYEAMNQIGSGLGSAGFIVYLEDADIVSVVAGASRFLAVESCGQCTPCKQDGLGLSELLAKLAASDADGDDIDEIRGLVKTVADSARCSLAVQHENLVGSLLDHFGDDVARHLDGSAPPVEPVLIGAAGKQPDWTFDETDSGKPPAERLATIPPVSETASEPESREHRGHTN